MNTIKAKNLTAQISHSAAGNPPGTLPEFAISNFFPGLEFDLRSVWKHIFVDIELHESGRVTEGHQVVDVIPGSDADNAGVRPFDRLVEVDGQAVESRVTNPSGQPTNATAALEFFNALADIAQMAGRKVPCAFVGSTGRIEVDLEVRNIFDGAALSRELLEPGAMTQGLCSPWQADYRECGCFYWAASRPDFVNADVADDASVTGHDWMQRDRSPGIPYRADAGATSPDHFNYDDLYRDWERILTFVVGGKDSE